MLTHRSSLERDHVAFLDLAAIHREHLRYISQNQRIGVARDGNQSECHWVSTNQVSPSTQQLGREWQVGRVTLGATSRCPYTPISSSISDSSQSWQHAAFLNQGDCESVYTQ